MPTRIVGLASTTLSQFLSQVSVFHTASSFCKSSNIIRIAVITINNNEIINFIYIRIKIFPPLPTTHPAKSTMPPASWWHSFRPHLAWNFSDFISVKRCSLESLAASELRGWMVGVKVVGWNHSSSIFSAAAHTTIPQYGTMKHLLVMAPGNNYENWEHNRAAVALDLGVLAPLQSHFRVVYEFLDNIGPPQRSGRGFGLICCVKRVTPKLVGLLIKHDIFHWIP